MRARVRARLGVLGGALILVLTAMPGGPAAARLATSVSGPVTSAFRAVPTGTTRVNQNCPAETAFYDPGAGQDIAVPKGYQVQVFARDLNQPTAIAFMGDGKNFRVAVLESGSGLPSPCNRADGPGYGGVNDANNPFTSDLLLFDQSGKQIGGPIGKSGSGPNTFQAMGPAIGLTFEKGFAGGRLFATDSNQQTDTGSPNNSSRIVTVDLATGAVTPFIAPLPTGDHPTEQVVVKDGWIYWSQGSATNSGVVGLDNGGKGGQPDIPCQTVQLSANTFSSGNGVSTSGYSPFGTARPGATVNAFEGAPNGEQVCTGAIMRAQINASNPVSTMQPYSWGYRNPYAIRFSPSDSALGGALLVGENGEDERGARPTNNSPDRLQLAQMNPDGTPDYHGWPDQFGFLASTQRAFDPIGGPSDDLCAGLSASQCAATVQAQDVPVKSVLDHSPQTPVLPLSLLDADSSPSGIDFAGKAFASPLAPVGAAMLTREGDFGFSPPNGDPEGGHDLLAFNPSRPGQPYSLSKLRFAFNCLAADQRSNPSTGAPTCTNGGADQAFEAQIHGFNRPTFAMFGPDGALWVVDYGAVRDQGSGTHVVNPADGPLAEVPFTGTVYRITRTGS